MNDFTKDELTYLHDSVVRSVIEFSNKNLETVSDAFKQLTKKLEFMIDNYQEDPWHRKKIVESHLKDSMSLISHAMCLLGMKEEE